MHFQIRLLRVPLVIGFLSLAGMAAYGEEEPVESPLTAACTGCHIPDSDGALSRIRDQRKTAEGWEMTINRMRLIHGLKLSGQEIAIARSSMRELVKHLADTQGLAPQEAAPYRYLLEQDLNQFEQVDPELAVMCGRCHSSARFALQRRSKEEWERLVHFHLGQYPSTEYSLYGRDRDWMGQALNESVPALTEKFPLHTQAWSDWQATDKPALAGRWVISGHLAGKGYLHAVMTVTETAPDYYGLEVEGHLGDGEALSGVGKAVVYTGYDWRAQLELGGVTMRQVLAADASGNTLNGRMFYRDQELQGVRLSAVRDNGQARVSGVYPTYIRRGSSQVITISGTGLDGKVSLPPGLSVGQVIQRDNNKIVLDVIAADNAPVGRGNVAVGPATLADALAVYTRISSLSVEPAFAVARVGDNGGSTPKVNAAFRAVGVDHGPDNTPGTADDLRLGYIDAVTWQVQPWDETAKQDEDVRFAGKMDQHSGIFHPAGAGPNPERTRSTNNAGNLQVVATLEEGDVEVSGEAQLIVTVQRWNNPPLK